jgi:hypothetical protein
MLRVGPRAVDFVGMEAEIPVPGDRFELTVENGLWVQRNLTLGKTVILRPPWLITPEMMGFNFITESLRAWRARAPFWWKQGSTLCSPTAF